MGPLAKQLPVQLVGRSEAIREIDAAISRAARCDAKVLITGETGVGKEVITRLIHQRSARAAAPIVTVNCAGLPDSLLESELFGHVRGSFTGAYRDKPGLLEMAPNGTLFMDEVGEMSTRMQVVLLRFLDTAEVQRVGAERAHARVNVRLITATNRDLQAHIASGGFREDLYFRLNVIRLLVPPLRDRTEDIPVLIDHYLTVYSERHATPRPAISPSAMDAFMSHGWPGNVRELKNVVERIVLRADGHEVTRGDLPIDVFQRVQPVAAPAAPAPQASKVAAELAARMMSGDESFWNIVYPAFIERNLTCDDLRAVIGRGLECTSGNYRSLVRLFNMPPEDYKRFLRFLRKHHCNLPFQPFREASARLDPARVRDKANAETDDIRNPTFV
jgi:transcriptional regulator with GAF, ATPase, and Fis domain